MGNDSIKCGIGKKYFNLAKKLTSVLLTFLFIVSSLSPAFAASNALAAPAAGASTASAASDSIGSPASVTAAAIGSAAPDAGDSGNTMSGQVVSGTAAAATTPASAPSQDVSAGAAGTAKSAPPGKDKKGGNTGASAQTMTSAATNTQSQSGYKPGQEIKLNLAKSDSVSGSLVYDYQINVPPGRNGAQPDLKLQYNSQSTQNGSIFGYGWSVNIPYIERVNKTGIEKLYTDNYFNSSLNGEIVSLGGTLYGAKVDNGEFLKYEFSNNSWTVIDKQGTKYKFGASAATRQDSPNDSTKVFKWMLEETRDTNDNYVRYEYYKDAGQIYPYRIYYTGSGATDGIFQIEFSRETRTDADPLYQTGFSVKSNYRINQIQTKVNGAWTRQYALSYSAGANAARSILSSITESGKDDSGTIISLLAMTFNYQNSANGWNINGSWVPPTDKYTGKPFSFLDENYNDRGVQIADVNGDGLPDLIQSTIDANYQWLYAIYINNGAGWTLDPTWNLPDDGGSDSLLFRGPQGDQGVRIADVNGDGLPDFIRSKVKYDSSKGFYSDNGVYINNGHGWTKDTTWTFPVDTYTNIGTFSIAFSVAMNAYSAYDPGTRIMDVNGDGLPDLVRSVQRYSYARGYYTDSVVYLNSGRGWTFNTSLSLPVSFVDGSPNDLGVRIADVNGDGLPDLVKSRHYWNGTARIDAGNGVYLNTGNGWVLDNSWNLPIDEEDGLQMPLAFVYNYADLGLRFDDVNGDGLPDLIRSVSLSLPSTGGGTSAYYSGVYINNGHGWTKDISAVFPMETANGVSHPLVFTNANVDSGSRDVGVNLMDVNGDGLSDFIKSRIVWSNALMSYVPDYGIYLNSAKKSDLLGKIKYSGGGWTDATYKPSAQYVSGNTLLNPNLPLNLDTVYQLSHNNGLGSSSGVTYSYEAGKYYYGGILDRKFAGFGKVSETDSAGNVTKTYYHQGDATNSTQGEYADHISKAGKPYRVEVYDNADNLYSKTINKWENYNATSDLPNNTNLKSYWSFNENSGLVANDGSGGGNNGSLAGGMGASNWTSGISGSALSFNGTTNYVSATNSPVLNGDRTISAWIKPQAGTDPMTILEEGVSGAAQMYYIYSNGVLAVDSWARGWYGVSTPISMGQWNHVAFVYSSATQKAKFYVNGVFVAETPAYASGFFNTSSVYIGGDPLNSSGNYYNGAIDEARVYNRILSDNEISALYRNPAAIQINRNFVKLTQTIDSSYDGLATHRDKAETYVYDNTNGNLTEKDQWGEVNGTDSGTFTDVGSDKLVTSISYASNTSLNITGLSSEESTADQSGAQIKDTRHYYDGLILGSVNKGNPTKGENWVSGSNYINTQKAYNSYGLVTQDTDARGNATTYVYDSHNLYPATVTNALNQATQYIYSYSSGKAKQTINPHNYTFQANYDGFGRLIEEKQPDLAAPSALVTKTAYVYTDTFPNSVKKTDYLDSANSADAYSYFDGLGRLVQTRKEAEDANNFSAKDLVYNNRGLLQKESLPYFSSGSSRTSAAGDSTLYSSYAYDPLGRITSATNAVGTVTNAYNNWKTTVTDAKGTPKDLYKDVYDRLVQVGEHNGASTYTTTYNYDGAGDLTKITDASGNVRNFTYDGLGRRLTAEDLHASADATFGVWSYTYDANGNLVSQLDPKNQTVNYTYDALNRQLTEDYAGQAGTEVNYTYDTCINGVGRLCSVTSASEIDVKQYNALGLTSAETKTIGSVNYSTSYAYDRQGNQTLITNPDNSQVKYEYNSAGLLEKVSNKESADTNFSNLVTNFNYSPLEKVIYEEDANGTRTTNTYDAAQLYRLKTKQTQVPFNKISYDSSRNGIFNGTNAVVFPAFNSDTLRVNFTAMPYNVNGYKTIERQMPDATGGHAVRIGNGKFQAFVRDTDGTLIYNQGTEGFTLLPYQTYNGYATYDKNNLDIYIESPLGSGNYSLYSRVAGTGKAIGAVNDNVEIGKWVSGSGESFEGEIKKVQIGNLSMTGDTRTYDETSKVFTGQNLVFVPPITYSTLSISADFTPYQTQATGNIVRAFPATADSGYGLRVINNKVQALVIDENGTLIFTPATTEPNISSNQEITVLATYDKNYLTVYVNGALYSQVPGTGKGVKAVPSGNMAEVGGFYNWDKTFVEGFSGEIKSLTMSNLSADYANPASSVQNLSYTYDTNGNITRIVDSSGTLSGKTVDYTYDPLNRLTSAVSSNAANGQDYTETYSYDAIGNITSKNSQSYSYSSAGKANPHAVTSIGSINYTYDDNGNLLTVSGGLTNTWDYDNRLTQSIIGSTTVSYSYDAGGERIKYSTGATTTVYPSKYYNTDRITPVKHIFTGDTFIATIKGTGVNAKVYPISTDHLTGSNVVTNSAGTTEEFIDYYPYGDIRLDEKASSFSEQKKYAGHEYDTDNGLSYMQARYYNGKIGRFISEDSAFLAVGDTKQFKNITNQDTASFLIDLQQLNSYSYAGNNPIIHTDPTGNCIEDLCVGEATIAAAAIVMYAPQIMSFGQSLITPLGQSGIIQAVEDARQGHYGWAMLGFATSGELPEAKALSVVGKAEETVKISEKYFWGIPNKLLDHFERHGADFGAKNAEDYARKAQEFLKNSQKNGFETKIDKEGVIRVYDPKTNTFGSYNPNGSTKTFYKPDSSQHSFSTNIDYWKAQKGGALWKP